MKGIAIVLFIMATLVVALFAVSVANDGKIGIEVLPIGIGLFVSGVFCYAIGDIQATLKSIHSEIQNLRFDKMNKTLPE